MNSLSDLNTYVNGLSFTYTDQREANVIFDRAAAENQSQITDEGLDILSTVGIEITDVYNAAVSLPYYTIDVRNLTGATVSWASLPDGVTESEPTPGIYRLDGIDNVEIWDAVKNATISLPGDFFGLYTYTSTIGYFSVEDGNQTKSWTTALSINDVTYLSTPLSVVFDLDMVNDITNTPNIIDLDASYPSATWTITITPNTTSPIDTFTSEGTGGTFTVNASTKVVTIVGTRAQVNSHLNSLKMDSNNNSFDITLTYFLTNSQDANTDNVVQLLINQDLVLLGAVTNPTVFYTEDTPGTISGYPLLTDSVYDGSGTYTYTVTPSTTAAVQTLSTSGSSGSQSFNSTTKVLTLTGTRDQINSRLTTLSYDPGIDFADSFTMNYTVTTPRFETATKFQAFVCGSNDTEITNMNLNRSYIGNRPNYIFTSSIPSITDFDTDNDAYALSFSVPSAAGYLAFGTDLPTGNTITFAGTRAQCNDKFSQVRYYPVKDLSTNVTLTYVQTKTTAAGTITQVNQPVTLIGSAGVFQNPREFDLATGNFTPDFEDALYGDWFLLLVGGGGGATTGGGGGGEILRVYGLTLPYQTYSVNVGQGGAGGALIGGTILAGDGTASTFSFPSGGAVYSAAGGYAPPSPNTYRKGGNGGGFNTPGNPRYAGAGGTGDLNYISGAGGGAGANGGPHILNPDILIDGENTNNTRGGDGGRPGDTVNEDGSLAAEGLYGGGGGGYSDNTFSTTTRVNQAGRGGNQVTAPFAPTDGRGGGGGGGAGGYGTRGGHGLVHVTIRA